MCPENSDPLNKHREKYQPSWNLTCAWEVTYCYKYNTRI